MYSSNDIMELRYVLFPYASLLPCGVNKLTLTLGISKTLYESTSIMALAMQGQNNCQIKDEKHYIS